MIEERTKPAVAILGAGPSGLAAAFALARMGIYDVHLYQVGWRAGGKCTTGREPQHLRAKQNGSHYLFGCYYNAFALIREAHAIIDKLGGEEDKGAFGSFEDDFVARNLLVGKQRYKTSKRGSEEGDWYRYLPQNLDTPGVGGKFPSPFDWAFTAMQFFFGTIIDLLLSLLFFWSDSERFSGVRFFLRIFPVGPFEKGLWPRLIRGVLLPIRWIFNYVVFYPLQSVAQAILGLVTALLPGRFVRWMWRAWPIVWRGLVIAVRTAAGAALWVFLRLPGNVARRAERLFILFDLGLTILVGYYRDELNVPGHFEAIDDLDFRKWLERHGARPETVESALVTTWYDATIAYVHGDRKQARCGAGVCVHSLLRSLATYKGAFAYQMRAEVGDSYIAPVVRALELLEVKFHFYHRARRVVTDAESRLVTELVFDRQSMLDLGRAEFTEVPDHSKRGSPKRKAWPAEPLREIPTGSGEPPIDSYYSTFRVDQVSLRRRTTFRDETTGDFDFVISALPIGVVDDVLVDQAGERLAAAPGRWRDCHANVLVTESQAIRMWFNVPLGPQTWRGRSLGWKHDPPILSGYDWPHSTWEDNSQAVHVQAFPENQQPSAIATVFGPLETGTSDVRQPAHLHAQRERAERAARQFIEQSMLELWPGLESPPGSKQVDWSSFVDLPGRIGPLRFSWQHISANVGPAESYVMCLPGTLKYRLRPDESGFRNLYLAGDWTRNGVEVGTVEGAVMSGLKAAQALSGIPVEIVGGDDFDRGTLFE